MKRGKIKNDDNGPFLIGFTRSAAVCFFAPKMFIQTAIIRGSALFSVIFRHFYFGALLRIVSFRVCVILNLWPECFFFVCFAYNRWGWIQLKLINCVAFVTFVLLSNFSTFYELSAFEESLGKFIAKVGFESMISISRSHLCLNASYYNKL